VPVTTHGIKFNLMVSVDCETYICSNDIKQRNGHKMKIHAQRKDRRGDLLPVIATAIVAIVGTAGILYNLGSGNDAQGSGNATMISAAAVSRAGAIEIPSEPPAGWD
jgi:hypothetical protein